MPTTSANIGPARKQMAAKAICGLPFAAVACCVLYAPLANADDEKNAAASTGVEKDEGAAAVEASDDVQDLLFLGPMRPVVIRLHVKIHGEPYRKAWRDNIHKLLIVADTNRNGAIDVEQPSRPGDAKGKRRLAEIDVFAASAAAYLGQEIAQAKAGLHQLAGEQGGALREPALTAYFERVAPPFGIMARAEAQQRYEYGMTPAPALFPLLDSNGDQALSREELEAAEQRLANRDFNEDEVISPRELMVAPDASLAAAEQPETQRQTVLPGAGPLFVLAENEDPQRIADALLERYDIDGDQELSTGVGGEVEMHAPRLRRLDADGDGRLTRQELAAFAQQGPDMELTNLIGRRSYVPKARLDKLARLNSPDDERVSVKSRHNGFELSLADATIRLHINRRDPSRNNTDGPELRSFDADGNGYLDAEELKDNPELSQAFVSLDLDGDGKLFADEFHIYAQRQNRAAALRLLLEVTDGGQQLLGVLDTGPTRDSVLSVRELRSAAVAAAAQRFEPRRPAGGQRNPATHEHRVVSQHGRRRPRGRRAADGRRAGRQRGAARRPAVVSEARSQSRWRRQPPRVRRAGSDLRPA